MPQKIKVKSFFKTLASKSRAEGQAYLKELREQMDVKSFAEAHELGLFSNKKFTRSNAIRLDKYADEGSVMSYNNVRVLKDYPRSKAKAIEADDPDVAPLTPEQQKEVDEVSQVKDMDDARTVAEDTAKRLSEEAFRKRAEEVAKEIAERLTKEAFAKKKAGELGKSVFNARKVAQEVADRLSKDAMEIADTTAVAEAKAKEKRADMLRSNPKASQRDKKEEREYAREDTNKEQRAKEVDKRRQALDRWSNDPEADTDDLLRELGFNKRQINDNTDAQVKRARQTLSDYTSAELTEAELFEMMDMLIDPPTAPTQSPDERDAKPKAKQEVSSSGGRRPMAERPIFRVDAKRQAEEALEMDKKALSMKKQQKKGEGQKKARDAKVQQARSNMRQEVEVSASGGSSGGRKLDNEYQRILTGIMINGYAGKYGSRLSALPSSFVNDVLLVQDETSFTNFYAKMVEQFGEPSGIEGTEFYTQPRPPARSQADVDRAKKMAGHFDNIPKKSAPVDTSAGTGSGVPPPRPTMTRPERSDSMSSGDDFPTPIITDTPRAPSGGGGGGDDDGDDPMGGGGGGAPPPPPPAGVGVQQPDVPAQGMSLGASSGVSSASGGGGLASSKAELIPKERLSTEGKSPQELLADIMYFFKNFASQLKLIKAKWDKLSKRQKSNEAVLKRYHGEIVGRLQPEGSKSEEGKVGIVVDAEQYIEMKMREIMLDARFANMQPAELVDVNEGIKKKQASDMGAFEVRQGLRGGKSFVQREPVYKAISTSQPDQLAVQMRPAGKATQPKRLSLMPAKQINLCTTAKKFNSANPFARSVPTITFQVLK